MESPLNSAHLQERKAESFLSCHEFSEAIKCYQKAAEYLIEAMKLTQVTQALASIQLQYENSLRQEKVIKDKWQRYEVQQERLRLEKERRLKRELQEKRTEKSPKKLSSDLVDGQKSCEKLDTSTCSLIISAENFSVSSLSSSTEFLTSKDDKDELLELRNQVRDLRIQQLSLTQALEDSNRENTKLKRTVSVLKEILKKELNMDFDEDELAGDIDEESREESNELSNSISGTETINYDVMNEKVEKY
ncbi:nuclear receptor-binding factor 2-like [Actinia tenebrosa]|uniref:Nuclear receptor-binding factor 2-like n=1 Tax=Actinia tenebrosa TaxID=6105 RepID=A0A6P8IKQ0_ACTTE|nr:nuclear receptor-binding factor 2-like [Actinia tenebrosa]